MSNGAKHPQEFHGSPPPPLPSLQQQALDEFWRKTLENIENTVDFNNHILPKAYVTKLIRDNQGSLMMSPDTPPVLTKLLEIFIQELTVRASMCATSHDRSTILESDIHEAINSRGSHVFLNDVIQGTNHDEVYMSSNAHVLHQEPNFLVESNTLTEATSTQINPLELKNDQDLNNISDTSSGSIEETK